MSPLRINLRHLATKDLLLEGDLSPAELELDGLDSLVHAREAVRYELEVQKMDEGLLITGQVSTELHCECARCLKPFVMELKLSQVVLELPLEGEEKVPIDGDFVDLTPYLREDIVLAFPQHPLCDPECVGLKQEHASGAEAPAGAKSQMTSSVWSVLNELKLK